MNTRIIGLRSGRVLRDLRGHDAGVTCVSFAGDRDKTVLSSSMDGTLRVCEICFFRYGMLRMGNVLGLFVHVWMYQRCVFRRHILHPFFEFVFSETIR